MSDTFDEFLIDFIAVARQKCDQFSDLLIVLEKNPQDVSCIETIFQILHTLKGNSGFFDLSGLKSLLHVMEDVLALVKEQRIKVTPYLIALLCNGQRQISKIIDSLKVNGNIDEIFDQDHDYLMKDFVGIVDCAKRNDSVGLWENIEKDIQLLKNNQSAHLEESQAVWQRLKYQLNVLSTISGAYEAQDISTNPLRNIRTILSREIDGCLDKKQEKLLEESLFLLMRQVDKKDQSKVQSAVKLCREYAKEMGITAFIAESILKELAGVEVANISGDGKEKDAQEQKAVRLNQKDWGDIFTLLGDMIYVLGRNESTLVSLSADSFSQAKIEMTAQIKRLKESVVQIKTKMLMANQIPVSDVTRYAKQVVMQTSELLGKKVSIEVYHDVLTLPQAVGDLLKEVLLHLLRNAIDHGIESPEVRRNLTKSEQGVLKLQINQDQKNINVTLEDNGAGIDDRKIKQKAVQLNLISDQEAQTMDAEKALQLVFSSGVTTTQQVTEVSGRGVGLDAVKEIVQKANGVISVKSFLNLGTKFYVAIPKDYGG